MDVKTIHEKSKALIKAAASGEAPAVIISILNELKAGVVASEDILRSTRIGVTVNKSKTSKNSEVARLASEIIRKWRDDIQKQKPSTSNGKSAKSTPPNGASPAPAQDKLSSSSSVPPDQRSWKKDNVDIARTKESVRNNCIGLMYDGLVHLSCVPPDKVLSVAIAVEAAAHTSLSADEYKAKMRSLYQNLKNKSNPSLRVKVVSGEIKPDRFIGMSHKELMSEERREEVANLEAENLKNSQAPVAPKSISTSLTVGSPSDVRSMWY
jgi:transcription elongation factor S-II